MTDVGVPFVVAHLSDLHIGEPGSTMDTVFEPADSLTRTLAALTDGPFRVDLVLITGDRSGNGRRVRAAGSHPHARSGARDGVAW